MCKSDVSFSFFVNIIHWYYIFLSLTRDKAVYYFEGKKETISDSHFQDFGAFCEALLVFLDTS